MQISPLLLQINSPIGINSNRALYEEKVNITQSETNINYSDSNINLNLSISTLSANIESIYTAEGIFDSSSFQSTVDIMSIPSDNTLSETFSQSTQMLEDAMNKYMEMISSQVDALLRKIAELQQRMLNSDGQDNDNNLTAITDGSVLKGYSVYSRQMLISSLEISSDTPVSDTGYYSPEETAERIINFALSFYDGGDRQEYAEMVRAAVMKGFEQAMAAFGDVLPQESYDTIGIVNSAIDNFAAGNDINISA
ncbi:hypothetical protein ACFL6H_00215 [Candidatus Latescibacterota bacterium]